ncbi:hypothetical protein BHM03_00020569 [Ensete ventricosum]|nr:hypothetical protein BHM03_00020569 [Ensete ventricosum]
MTVCRLAEVQKRFYTPAEYELYVPLPKQCPYDAFPNDFRLSIDALETEGPVAMEYVRGSLHLSLAKQLYESSSEELMDQATKLAVCACVL